MHVEGQVLMAEQCPVKRTSSKPTARIRAGSVQGSEGWAGCSSKARSCAVHSGPDPMSADTVAQSVSQTTMRPPSSRPGTWRLAAPGTSTDLGPGATADECIGFHQHDGALDSTLVASFCACSSRRRGCVASIATIGLEPASNQPESGADPVPQPMSRIRSPGAAANASRTSRRRWTMSLVLYIRSVAWMSPRQQKRTHMKGTVTATAARPNRSVLAPIAQARTERDDRTTAKKVAPLAFEHHVSRPDRRQRVASSGRRSVPNQCAAGAKSRHVRDGSVVLDG